MKVTETAADEIMELSIKIRAACEGRSVGVIIFALADTIASFAEELDRADPEATGDKFLDHISVLIAIARADAREQATRTIQ